MSVSLNPSSSLGFNRPLTTLVKRSLTITNHNVQPVAFKVKTTAPKLYCVRPNSGRVEPGESVDVSVMLQAMKEEPPLTQKCKDKFLIQSTLITPEKETMALQDMWNGPEGGEEVKVHQQKLRVTYLPAEGQTLEEEDEGQPNITSLMSTGGSRFDTVQQHPIANGHPQPIPDFTNDQTHHDPRPITPPADFSVAREESHEEPHIVLDGPGFDSTNLQQEPFPSQPPIVSMPEPTPSPAPVIAPRTPPNAEIVAKYNLAQAEIERLKALLAAAPTSPPTELRRRTRALSDDGSTVAETDVVTMVDDGGFHQEGVPLQVVVIIALGVFITTYLFF